jgi:hypothetical protein
MREIAAILAIRGKQAQARARLRRRGFGQGSRALTGTHESNAQSLLRRPNGPWFGVAVSSGKTNQRDARDERLRAALRENLKRRKAQARGRAAAGGAQRPEPAERHEDAPDFRRNPGRD